MGWVAWGSRERPRLESQMYEDVMMYTIMRILDMYWDDRLIENERK
jgi:hypothetical protein